MTGNLGKQKIKSTGDETSNHGSSSSSAAAAGAAAGAAATEDHQNTSEGASQDRFENFPDDVLRLIIGQFELYTRDRAVIGRVNRKFRAIHNESLPQTYKQLLKLCNGQFRPKPPADASDSAGAGAGGAAAAAAATGTTEGDDPIITINDVSSIYLKIRQRLIFEVRHFHEGQGRQACPDEFKDKLKEMAAVITNGRKPNPLKLEQIDAILDKINAKIIQDKINSNPRACELEISNSNLTRFPESVIKDNFKFFQLLLKLSCQGNKLQALPDFFGEACQSLCVLFCQNNQLQELPNSIESFKGLLILDCSDNQLEALPNSIGSFHMLTLFSCDNNQLQALPQGLEKFTLGAQNPRRTVASGASASAAAAPVAADDADSTSGSKKKRTRNDFVGAGAEAAAATADTSASASEDEGTGDAPPPPAKARRKGL